MQITYSIHMRKSLYSNLCDIKLATERCEKGKTGKCAFAGTNFEAHVSILMCSLTEQRQGRARGVS
jgi:hypothetical protein